MPASESARNFVIALAASFMIALSVTSSSSIAAGIRWRMRASATCSAKSSSSRLAADTLTETGIVRPRSIQALVWRSAASSTQAVMSRTCCEFSMIAMNSPGETGPNSGWVQRSSTSTATQAPLAMSMRGWNTTDNWSSALSASAKSSSSRKAR